MKRKIKMMLYGVPSVGKSVFALQFPKPFFITTDGNYEWLDEFGAKEEDHKQVNSWKEFESFIKNNAFSKYETIVIDLIEDLFKWCEAEFCVKNKLEYVGDMAYGKGYRITRDDFFVEISKLLALPKNIIFLSHESMQVVKDKRGVETTLYYPSKTIPEPLRDAIEGRLRYVLRARFEDEISGEKVIQKRMLSLAGDSSEFSIIRGVDMSKIPDRIELNYNEFVKALNLEDTIEQQKADVKLKEAETIVEALNENKEAVKVSIQEPFIKQTLKDEVVVNEVKLETPKVVEVSGTPTKEELLKLLERKEVIVPKVEAPVSTPVAPTPQVEVKPVVEVKTTEDKEAKALKIKEAILAKLKLIKGA